MFSFVRWFAAALAIMLSLMAQPVFALYEWSNDVTQGEIQGLVRVYGAAFQPVNINGEDDDPIAGLAGIARLMTKAHAGKPWSLNFNAYQTYIPTDLSSPQQSSTALDVERSSALEWSFSDDELVRLAIDHLNLRWSHERWDIIAGRQPINLATTYYFSPNDFFAPFSAQQFFRIYKPGVDAVRAEYRLAELTQLSLISVLGYQTDADSDTGWSRSANGERTSYIGRLSTVWRDTEWTVLLGRVKENEVIGASLQGELFDWLGLRSEGHFGRTMDEDEDFAALSVGFEHRWENSLHGKLEYFYNSLGAGETTDYLAPGAGLMTTSYLARNYVAAGASYQISPLLLGDALWLHNITDSSNLALINAIYSLSDESELALSIAWPLGEAPEQGQLQSEFGTYPRAAFLEWRGFF
ncbi:MAG: hypothetical protein BMS9Abin36_1388 [Gammaproteobacteria bacterium]|nr:MAG: hypothetical protein BMS9Abin36_1388 [Gammaproteobacteria bacterium]